MKERTPGIDMLTTLARFEDELDRGPEARRHAFLIGILRSLQWDSQLDKRSRSRARQLLRRFDFA